MRHLRKFLAGLLAIIWVFGGGYEGCCASARRVDAPRHIMLRSNPPGVPSQADTEYLQSKGALALLLPSSHEKLLRAYFQHVHPMLRILSLSKLGEMRSTDTITLHGMLLYWSMAVVSANVSYTDELEEPQLIVA